MRVATVITRLNIGGASPPVISLVVGLRDRGHETVLVVGTPQPGEGTLEAEAVEAGATVVKIPELQRDIHAVRDTQALRRLIGIMRDFRPDVVATHMSKAGALGRVAARLTGAPVVVHTYHGKGFDVFKAGWRRNSALWAERILARVDTGNILISDKQRREFLQLRVAGADRLRLIRLGLALEPFIEAAGRRGSLRRDLALDDEVPLVGVVARIVAIKGQDVFLRAAALTAARCPRVQFVLVGDGPFRPPCEALVQELGLDGRVHFLGWRRDIPHLLAAFDLVALPTVKDFEGTPVALIEAMAARRAVVATDVGGVADVVQAGDTGLLVAPGDATALSDGMVRLLSDADLRAALARKGQEFVCQRHRLDRMVIETEAYFAELLRAAGR